MYTDVVTHEAQRTENHLILWSKGTYISLEAFMSKFFLSVISICLGSGTNLLFLASSRNNFQWFLEGLPRVPNTPEFVCSYFDLVTYMYTDVVTHEAQRTENLILWSKGTYISLEVVMSIFDSFLVF